MSSNSESPEKKPWGLLIAILVVPLLLIVVPVLLKKLM